jgi:hypothetical protein
MSVVAGSILSYCLIHFLFVVKTGYSSFYWASRLMFHLEALQNGMFRSIPHWFEWWRYMAHEERKEKKGL